jgi:hypothetical protein
MWFKIFKYDKKAQLKCHELTAIVTQNSIVDVIEEFDQRYLEKIDYIGHLIVPPCILCLNRCNQSFLNTVGQILLLHLQCLND